MQSIAVLVTMLLYAIFAFNPLVEIPVLSRTLNMSPGDFMMIVIVIAIAIKALVRQKDARPSSGRSPAVNEFLITYIVLAAIFLAPTILFFILRNELANYIPRVLFNYLQWIIALVLFYFGSETQLKFQDVKMVLCLLGGGFLAGVFGNMFMEMPGLQLLQLIASTMTTQSMRLSGQIADPNQLGTIAAFFAIFGIAGLVKEPEIRLKSFFLLLTGGTGLIMLLTQSRESLTTFFVAIVCYTFLMLRERRYLPGIVLAFFLLFGVVFSFASIPRIAETLTAIDAGQTGDALSDRGRVWGVAWDIIASSPVGIGFETMALLTGYSVEQAHNAFLQAAVIAGIFGFVAFCYFYFSLFKLIWLRKQRCAKNWMLDGYLVFAVGYLVTSVGSDHFISFYTFNAIFFGLLGFVACTADDIRS